MAIRQNRVKQNFTTSSESVDLSVVIPVYNEEDNLEQLQDELDAALNALNIRYEIVFVNDGSRDNSASKLLEIANAHPNTVTFVDLRRNFGQTAAMSAGIDHSTGNIVVLMDADRQNDPADIGMLLGKLDEGYDVVSGWRYNRHDKFLTRRVPSMAANRLISWITGVRLHDYGCSLKAYRREVVDQIQLYGEMHRFIPVYAKVAGAQIAEVKVNHRPRVHGKSNYGLERTFKVLMDLITIRFLLRYHSKPMYLFGGVGAFLMGLSAITLLIAFLNKWIRGVFLIQTPLPQIASMFFVIGIQSILMGLVAELLVRTYYESQGKTIYVVRRVVRSSSNSNNE
ncbi:MAG: glycosyltransferase family 2 protein [Anaerolineae bacterium]|nr:glycosyltransferase family 2 protein [Anaerolineae bacterium]